MATKKQKYVTEEYLDKRFTEFKQEIIQFMLDLHESMKNELYEIKDIIVGEIKGYREEHDAHQVSHLRINDTLIKHGKRLKKLENSSKN